LVTYLITALAMAIGMMLVCPPSAALSAEHGLDGTRWVTRRATAPTPAMRATVARMPSHVAPSRRERPAPPSNKQPVVIDEDGSRRPSNQPHSRRISIRTVPLNHGSTIQDFRPYANSSTHPVVSHPTTATRESNDFANSPAPGRAPERTVTDRMYEMLYASKPQIARHDPRVQRAQFQPPEAMALSELVEPSEPEIQPAPSGTGGAENDPFGDDQDVIVPAAEPVDSRDLFKVIEHTRELKIALRRSKLLQSKLDIVRTAVVDPDVCDVVQFTPREISVIGKRQGTTNITFWFLNGNREPVTYLVTVAPDVKRREELEDQYRLLAEALAEMFPDSKVQLIPIADKLIVRGQVKCAKEAAQIMAIVRSGGQGGSQNNARWGSGWGGRGGGWGGSIADAQAAPVLLEGEMGQDLFAGIQIVNMLEIPGEQQVALRVKIAELNRSAARGFGVDLNAQIDFRNKGGNNLIIESLLNVASGNTTAILGSFDGDDINFGVHYLQEHGVLRLLSEPTLVTLSGQPATFVAGGEFAVPTIVGTGGLNAITTDFRSFGAIISFVPVVVDKDRIRLQIAPEFSQINPDLQVGDTPGLDVRAITTTVEMREGQTLAVAGLLEDSMQATRIGDVPLLEKIFGSRDVTRNETELIILVTPELVHAMEPEEVPPLPGFDVTEPTNGQFFFKGELEGNPTIQYRSTVWPRLRRRYRAGGPAMISGPFGHGQ